MKIATYQKNYTKITLLAAALGVVAGYYNVSSVVHCSIFISKIFVNILELLSIPLIFLSIVSTISGMDSFAEMKILGIKVLKYTLLTTILSATIGLLIYLMINPALAMNTIVNSSGEPASAAGSYVHFIANVIPSNIVTLFGENGNVIAVVLFAMLVSISTLHLPKGQKTVLQELFSSLFALMLYMANFVILLLPIGIFGFVTQLFLTISSGQQEIASLMWYSLCILLANVVQGVFILPLFLWYAGISPTTFFKQVSHAITMAFLSKSSSTTLPVSMGCATNGAGMSQRVASFVLPLCTTINMNGCAAFMLITILFVATSNGVYFSLFDMIIWIFIVTAAAIGNAGIPMGCYFLTSAFLVSMNIPLYLLGAILPLYAFFDMVETALNVWSDLVVAAVIDKELHEKN